MNNKIPIEDRKHNRLQLRVGIKTISYIKNNFKEPGYLCKERTYKESFSGKQTHASKHIHKINLYPL